MSESYLGQLGLVAGGTGGLGRAVSVAFLEEGATVVVTYRKENEFEALRDAAGAHASRLEGMGSMLRMTLLFIR
jgi:NAD(P)-dependent dehydrogenase (short-subunit alcohol dehydrogenase family)